MSYEQQNHSLALLEEGTFDLEVGKLDSDMKDAAKLLSREEARFLVDSYYQRQEDRIRSKARSRTFEAGDEPNRLVEWLADRDGVLEVRVRQMLGIWAGERTSGEWAMSLVGVGPVIAAGIEAFVDITRAPTVGHIWRYAGLDPTVRWQSADATVAQLKEMGISATPSDSEVDAAGAFFGRDPVTLRREMRGDTRAALGAAIARRPWNALLKRIVTFYAGESFVKVQNRGSFYGNVFRQRKDAEMARNEAGEYADQAAASLASKKWDKSTDAYKALIEGRLPQAQIHARARRYAAKLFLAHWHEVAYRAHHNAEPPKPYVIAHLGHAHLITASDVLAWEAAKKAEIKAAKG